MKIHEVIERALHDPVFAAELTAKALKASKVGTKKGFASDEWNDLLKEFAENPDELAKLVSPDRITAQATAATTVTTATGIHCLTTTTTTATTI